jgi:hypothetical protein
MLQISERNEGCHTIEHQRVFMSSISGFFSAGASIVP